MLLFFKSILTLFLFLTLLSCSETKTKYRWDKSEFLIEEYPYCQKWIVSPVNEYDSAYVCEQINDLHFPTCEVSYGKLIYNNGELGGNFTHNQTYLHLDQKFIEAFKSITRDSSNFKWGELGTQYTGCIMEFYNKEDELINMATLTWGGMMTTTPYLKATKWGLLNDKGFKAMFELLDKLEKNGQ